jgi:hypothetical protein
MAKLRKVNIRRLAKSESLKYAPVKRGEPLVNHLSAQTISSHLREGFREGFVAGIQWLKENHDKINLDDIP